MSSNPLAQVLEIGRSQQNRPLLLAKIGSGGEDAEKQNPCVLIYAGEHADEHDAMWAAQGAIEYLLSDGTEAKQLRDQFTFLVIPMLDPDAAVAGKHEGFIASFLLKKEPLKPLPMQIGFKTGSMLESAWTWYLTSTMCNRRERPRFPAP